MKHGLCHSIVRSPYLFHVLCKLFVKRWTFFLHNSGRTLGPIPRTFQNSFSKKTRLYSRKCIFLYNKSHLAMFCLASPSSARALLQDICDVTCGSQTGKLLDVSGLGFPEEGSLVGYYYPGQIGKMEPRISALIFLPLSLPPYLPLPPLSLSFFYLSNISDGDNGRVIVYHYCSRLPVTFLWEFE